MTNEQRWERLTHSEICSTPTPFCLEAWIEADTDLLSAHKVAEHITDFWFKKKRMMLHA
jgi:hypothetical protein